MLLAETHVSTRPEQIVEVRCGHGAQVNSLTRIDFRGDCQAAARFPRDGLHNFCRGRASPSGPETELCRLETVSLVGAEPSSSRFTTSSSSRLPSALPQRRSSSSNLLASFMNFLLARLRAEPEAERPDARPSTLPGLPCHPTFTKAKIGTGDSTNRAEVPDFGRHPTTALPAEARQKSMLLPGFFSAIARCYQVVLTR